MKPLEVKCPQCGQVVAITRSQQTAKHVLTSHRDCEFPGSRTPVPQGTHYAAKAAAKGGAA